MRPYFYILIRSWNTFSSLERCINSLLSQNYKGFEALFVDDGSNYSNKQRLFLQNKLSGHTITFNKERRYSVYNAYNMIHKYAIDDNAIIINLDGDDWLLPDALKTISAVYRKYPNCQMTYGECRIWDGKNISSEPSRYVLPNTNTPYPKSVVNRGSYRLEPFLPLHPRTWKVSLFKSIPIKEFLDSKGKWLRFAEDMAIFFPMLEKIQGNYKVIKKPIYVYNKANVHSDVAENTIPLLKDEIEIRKKHPTGKKYFTQRNKINVYYHKALSLPIIGNLLYLIQIKSLQNNLTNNIFLSLRKNNLRDNIIKILSEKSVAVIKSSKISEILKTLVSYKIFDCPEINLNTAKIDVLYNLMWTLVYCDAVTKDTKTMLSKILPSDYPVIIKIK